MSNRKEHAKRMVECKWCKQEFLCEYWRIQKRKNLFCSKKCENNYRKSKSELNCTCEVCGKLFHRKQSHIDKYKHLYCSIECHRKAKQEYMLGAKNHQYGLLGDKNASWKSDERISYYGYRLIRVIDHPFRNSDDMVFEHRLVAEKYLLTDENSVEIDGKKYLAEEYVVHHIDFNRLNNDVANLQVMLRNEHTKLHWQLRIKAELEKYCQENNIKYIDVSKNEYGITVDDDVNEVRNGGFGSTTK